ncbi:hypothetical protein [Nonomuraea sp. NEAU-A123]|uniref:hypothetical protein n=1 Tax=Nonomuraea sp. NEAU-A123 TaxID=2839649 RepID=UPI001BE495E2|nr:hypothetical protein [Nonomuraea sp. NEAU-A123]MBT2232782.1 hypothetical protein [Nonomuraea sp. NEAU-A123]
MLLAEVERALRTVPRHLFTGDVDLQAAYEDTAVVTKLNERGASMSSVSAPWLQAVMLGQADLKPGDRVLECVITRAPSGRVRFIARPKH